jgi:hypothetical protein
MRQFVSRVRNRVTGVLDRLTFPDKTEASRLVELLRRVPTQKDELETWTASVQSLIRNLVVAKTSKEDLALILTGLISYRQAGITPAATQHALIRTFERSAGLFQDVLHSALFERLGDEGPIESGLFGAVATSQIDGIVDEITREGYAVFPSKLDPALVERIRAESRDFAYRLKRGGQSDQLKTGIDPTCPPDCISAHATVLESSLLSSIANDKLFRRIASQYLCTPSSAIDSVLWYTFPSPTPDSETAQLFHYDLDTIRWIKVFIYLSDVGDENGPHEYVAGSHRAENKVAEVLIKNYARIQDSEIDAHYPAKRRRITGGSGTIIFGDTRCFHKGNAVDSGYRLIFSPIYAPSRIGYFHG